MTLCGVLRSLKRMCVYMYVYIHMAPCPLFLKNVVCKSILWKYFCCVWVIVCVWVMGIKSQFCWCACVFVLDIYISIYLYINFFGIYTHDFIFTYRNVYTCICRYICECIHIIYIWQVYPCLSVCKTKKLFFLLCVHRKKSNTVQSFWYVRFVFLLYTVTHAETHTDEDPSAFW